MAGTLIDAPPVDLDAISGATDLAEQFEGESLTPYQDITGVWTIGYGSTYGLDGARITRSTPPLTNAQARALLARDIKEAAVGTAALIDVTLSANQWAAIDDFVYNLGIGNFRTSTLLADINAGRLGDAEAEFAKWDHAGGKEIAGLLRRRMAEAELFGRA